MSDQRAGGIAWTDTSWNPVRGCTRVSPGCERCYAEEQALRITRFDRGRGVPEGQGAYDGLVKRVGAEARWTGLVRLVPEKLAEPLRWRRPRKVFVNSMSDLFHESLTNEEVAAVFGVMAAASRHTFQVLTKRPARLIEWASWAARQGEELLAAVSEPPPSGSPVGGALAVMTGEAVLGRCGFATACHAGWPLPNVWLGVSVENQTAADERIPLLLQTPAAVRWVSYEPALGPVDFTRWFSIRRSTGLSEWVKDGERNLLDWIVVGGESGRRARPFFLEWASGVVDQCRAAGVAVFVKQLGSRPELPALYGRPVRLRLEHDKGGNPDEWPPELRVREWPS